jgi:hypothetical protein
MAQDEYAVILVYSTSHALRLEKLLQGEGITCKLIPVPRQVSSDCGVCVRVLRPDLPAARRTVDAAGLKIVGIHRI